jgi:hypothetical protein
LHVTKDVTKSLNFADDFPNESAPVKRLHNANLIKLTDFDASDTEQRIMPDEAADDQEMDHDDEESKSEVQPHQAML